VNIITLAARGRGDSTLAWTASGMDSYDDVSLDALVEQEAMLETIPIPSPTFQVERKLELARRHMGERATQELLEKIREELEKTITADALMMLMVPPSPHDTPGEDDEDDPQAKKPGKE